MNTMKNAWLRRIMERVIFVVILLVLILPFLGCSASGRPAGNNPGSANQGKNQDENDNKKVTFVHREEGADKSTKRPPETLATAAPASLETPAAEPGTAPVRGIKITGDLVFRRNEQATLSINADPGVEYTITVYYNSGASEAEGLEPKTADADGNVSWTWRIGGRTAPGTYRVIIQGNGETIEREFTVITD